MTGRARRGQRNRLTAAFVAKVSKPGKYYDDHGMFLQVGPTGRRYFYQRLTIGHRRRELGLGSYPAVTLRDAQIAALGNKRDTLVGRDVLEARRRAAAPAFAAAARTVVPKMAKKWRDPRRAESTLRAMDRHIHPYIGDISVRDITARDLYDVLEALSEKHEATARNLRAIMSGIMRWCMREGYRDDDPAGPALHDLFHRGRRGENYRSVDYREIGPVMVRVSEADTFAAIKLWCRFLVLTACRSKEAAGAKWAEMELGNDQACWTVPATRTKAGEKHCVPLSAAALEVLRAAKHLSGRSEYVYPADTNKPYHTSRLSNLVRSLDVGTVPHGFRSTFATWAAESGVPLSVSKSCLAHRVGTIIDGTYHRTDFYGARCVVMEDWGRYVTERTAQARQASQC